MIEKKVNEDNTEIKIEIIELVREAIEIGTSDFITTNLDIMNDRDGFKYLLESIGTGNDILFRVIENSQINSVKTITKFINIVSLSTIIVCYANALSNELLQRLSYMSLKIEGKKDILDKDILAKMLEQCASAYTGQQNLLDKDEKLYREKISEIGIENLKEL